MTAMGGNAVSRVPQVIELPASGSELTGPAARAFSIACVAIRSLLVDWEIDAR